MRRLTLEHCWIQGQLSLQAPLEDLSWTGLSDLHVHEAFPLSNLLGLTYCQCHFIGEEYQDHLKASDAFYDHLPLMSNWKAFDFVPYMGALPPRLPASLQNIRYIIRAIKWDSRNLERIADTCQLRALQSISLLNCEKWDPSVKSLLKKVKEASKAKVILEEDWVCEEFSLMK